MFVISVGEEGGTESGIEDEETVARIPWLVGFVCVIPRRVVGFLAMVFSPSSCILQVYLFILYYLQSGI